MTAVQSSRGAFWGLVQQRGPWATTPQDRKNAHRKGVISIGGGIPAGGTVNAGHSIWASVTNLVPKPQNYPAPPPPKPSKWAMASVVLKKKSSAGRKPNLGRQKIKGVRGITGRGSAAAEQTKITQPTSQPFINVPTINPLTEPEGPPDLMQESSAGSSSTAPAGTVADDGREYFDAIEGLPMEYPGPPQQAGAFEREVDIEARQEAAPAINLHNPAFTTYRDTQQPAGVGYGLTNGADEASSMSTSSASSDAPSMGSAVTMKSIKYAESVRSMAMSARNVLMDIEDLPRGEIEYHADIKAIQEGVLELEEERRLLLEYVNQATPMDVDMDVDEPLPLLGFYAEPMQIDAHGLGQAAETTAVGPAITEDAILKAAEADPGFGDFLIRFFGSVTSLNTLLAERTHTVDQARIDILNRYIEPYIKLFKNLGFDTIAQLEEGSQLQRAHLARLYFMGLRFFEETHPQQNTQLQEQARVEQFYQQEAHAAARLPPPNLHTQITTQRGLVASNAQRESRSTMREIAPRNVVRSRSPGARLALEAPSRSSGVIRSHRDVSPEHRRPREKPGRLAIQAGPSSSSSQRRPSMQASPSTDRRQLEYKPASLASRALQPDPYARLPGPPIPTKPIELSIPSLASRAIQPEPNPRLSVLAAPPNRLAIQSTPTARRSIRGGGGGGPQGLSTQDVMTQALVSRRASVAGSDNSMGSGSSSSSSVNYRNALVHVPLGELVPARASTSKALTVKGSSRVAKVAESGAMVVSSGTKVVKSSKPPRKNGGNNGKKRKVIKAGK